MNDISLAAQAAAWQGALTRTGSLCATYYARRAPHWIGIGSRLWSEPRSMPEPAGRSLPEDLMRAAQVEIELRGEYTRRMLGELAERHLHLPSNQVLVDCTRLASELIRYGCRDVENDIVRTSQYLYGMDAGVVDRAMKAAIGRVTDKLLEVISRGPTAL
jgi:hypothetical protein